MRDEIEHGNIEANVGNGREDADDDDGSGIEEQVPAQGTEDAEMEVVVGAGEKVDSEKEVDGLVENAEEQDETMKE